MKPTFPVKDEATPDRVSQPVPALSVVVVSLSLPMLLSSLGTSMASVGLPTLADVFHTSLQQVQWVVLAYLLSITTLSVSAGRLGDLMGRRRLLLVGLFVFTGASVLCGLALSPAQLIAGRAVQGVGAAIMMSLTLALVGESVAKTQTGRVMGLLGTMSAVGTALGPSLGGLLLAHLNWSALFYVNVPLGLLALVLVYRFLPADRTVQELNFRVLDLPGTVMLILTLVSYALAMTTGKNPFGALNILLLGGAFLGAGVFAWTQSRTSTPLIQLKLFKTPTLGAGFVINLLVATVVMATLVVGPFYLSGALMLNAAQIGLVMSAGPVVSALSGIPAGHLVDRFGARPMILTGLSGMVLGCGLLQGASIQSGIAGYVLPLILTTAGYALFQAANNTAVMTQIQPAQRGVVSGLLGLSRNLGLITGASLMGMVFALGSGGTSGGAEWVVSGFHTTFLLAPGLAVAALVVALISQKLSQTVRK